MKICRVPGCGRSADYYPKMQLCHRHYARWHRAGRLHIIRRENGTGNINHSGYVEGRFEHGKREYEHVRIAELALGHSLPKGACVHHVNENRSDNRPENLVICPDDSYHKLLHRRMTALAACGNPNWRKCPQCQTWDDPKNFHRQNTHAECLSRAARIAYQRKKMAT